MRNRSFTLNRNSSRINLSQRRQEKSATLQDNKKQARQEKASKATVIANEPEEMER